MNEDQIPPAIKNALPSPPEKESDIKGFEWWRRTMQYQTGLGLTKEESKKYENDKIYKKNLKDCEKCYNYRDWILNYSPTVIFMLQQIKKTGVEIKDDEIICDLCDEWKGGGFNPELGILLCQNRIIDKWHLEDTLAHELVHYYDNSKFKVNWVDLKHHACSEIRASSLSGECRIMNQISRAGLGKFGRGHQECVKRRAALSVSANPNCKNKEEAKKIVDEVWDSCFNDTRPFEQIYR
ncbi:Mitochondrial inner membrane protease ATP23 [Wickerhamomyces ciferrii]|uniref:Mitochondrial inner membrane protease ATP23 n=1 Tax=Wickerhamomyces ciferrii (strain ATCC 14091 / BCRC 22168 / CBS 111 / JCM 3599 / NBRC 0793 / NRRL Y-1031 F-60-10) TaxID=1206466 RepID=K0KNW0_WICCF|nr:Mitochondrial inner membrane protease ATP23 [Wickerhamomyces ciferrii]CCH42778.1 Mitochondrial inner membrane protease ATP23 [Wickerhamomyces ciferrii]